MDLGGQFLWRVDIFKNDFQEQSQLDKVQLHQWDPGSRVDTEVRRADAEDGPPGGTCWDRQNHLYTCFCVPWSEVGYSLIPATWAWGRWEWMLRICMLAVGNWIRYPYWRMVISLSVGFCEPMIRNPEGWSGQKTSLGRWVVCIRWDASSGYPRRAQLIVGQKKNGFTSPNTMLSEGKRPKHC